MKTKVSQSVNFSNRLSRSGVSPDIEQLLPAGETPALLSRNHMAIGFRHHITAFFLILAAFHIAIAHAQQTADQSAGFTPQPGTPLRTALMDAIRLGDFYKTRELAHSNPEKIVFKVHFSSSKRRLGVGKCSSPEKRQGLRRTSLESHSQLRR